MWRIIPSVALSVKAVRSFATPAPKYVQIYNSDLSSRQYPAQLVGGMHVEFAKLLFTFAEECEGKNYKLFVDEFRKLDEIAATKGAFWAEENFLDAPAFKALNPGFKFLLAWMQSEGAIDRLDSVRRAYKELASEAAQECTAIVIVSQEPSAIKTQIEEIQKEVALVLRTTAFKDYKLSFEFKVDPSIGGGYIFEVAHQVVNKSTAAAAETAALEKATGTIVDWTAMPPAPPRPSPVAPENLVRLLGPVVDDMMDADRVELKYGA